MRDGSVVDDDEVKAEWMMSLVKTMRADMDNDKLYPPGDVYIMVCLPGSLLRSLINVLQEYRDVFVTVDAEALGKMGEQKSSSIKQAQRVVSHLMLLILPFSRLMLFSRFNGANRCKSDSESVSLMWTAHD